MPLSVNVIVCACGRRVEREGWIPTMGALRSPGHDPDECSRQVGFQGRFDGRREMAEAAVAHLIDRRTLSDEEVAEIRTNLLDLVTALPLGRRPPPTSPLLVRGGR